MDIPEYYMYEAERDGIGCICVKVTGYLVKKHNGDCLILDPIEGGWIEYEVKPETVKRVAMKAEKPADGSKASLNGYLFECPNCKEGVSVSHDHCKECGMALDWS